MESSWVLWWRLYLFVGGCSCMINVPARSDQPEVCGPRKFDSACDSAFFKKTLPVGIEKLVWEGANSGTQHPTARLCLGGYIASLYDCKLRIPLWTAMSLSGGEVQGERLSRNKKARFKYRTNDTPYPYRQDEKDWENAYKNHFIDKGHLIASSYASYYKNGSTQSREVAKERQEFTFSFFNVVPQFHHTNANDWSRCENKLIPWANALIPSLGSSVTLYILVGAVPRVPYLLERTAKKRSLQYLIKGTLQENRPPDGSGINVPEATWTGSSSS